MPSRSDDVIWQRPYEYHPGDPGSHPRRTTAPADGASGPAPDGTGVAHGRSEREGRIDSDAPGSPDGCALRESRRDAAIQGQASSRGRVTAMTLRVVRGVTE